MQSNEWFKNLNKEIKSSLAAYDFQRKGDAFARISSKAVASLKFRKSRETTKDCLVVTCSLGMRYFLLDKYHRMGPPLHMQSTETSDKSILCQELVGGAFQGFWRISTDAEYKYVVDQVIKLVPSISSLADKYRSPETFVSEYLDAISDAEQQRQNINTKNAVLVATYFLEIGELAKAENVIQRLRALSKDDGNGLKAIDMTWAYILQKSSSN